VNLDRDVPRRRKRPRKTLAVDVDVVVHVNVNVYVHVDVYESRNFSIRSNAFSKFFSDVA
jgi:hypothetical protein